MDYPTIPISITSTPIDWATVSAALFASFLGALSAFGFNLIQERLSDRRKRLDTVNAAINGLARSIETLLNIKNQYLNKFETEFARALYLLAEMNPAANAATIQELARNTHIVFQSIALQDATLNGAFKPLEEPDFMLMPDPEQLNFTLSITPELVRLIHLSKGQTNQVSKRVTERNKYRERKEASALKEIQSGAFTIESLLFYFEMLTYRMIIRQYTDVALVVMDESLNKLVHYRDVALKKRRRFFKWLLGPEIWIIRAPLSAKWLALMPNRTNYLDILTISTETD